MKIEKDIIHLWLIYLTSFAILIILGFSIYSAREIWEVTTREAQALDENIFNKSASLSKVSLITNKVLSHRRGESDQKMLAEKLELIRQLIQYSEVYSHHFNKKLINKIVEDDPLLIVARNEASQTLFDAKLKELAVLYLQPVDFNNQVKIVQRLSLIEDVARELILILDDRNRIIYQIGSHLHSNLEKGVQRLEVYLTYLIGFFIGLTALLTSLIYLYIRSRKKMVRELIDQRNHLEIRVAERTSVIAIQNRSLQSEIMERKTTEEKLKTTLNDKEVLLREIHHRVKNNMQVISSLLKLQASRAKNENIQAALNESQNKVFAMAAVHEALYKSENLSEIQVGHYVKKIAGFVFKSQLCDTSRVVLDIDSEEFGIKAETASPLGLVINELITNSLKYAFPMPKKGRIDIKINKDPNEMVTVIFKDNGIGLPVDIDTRKEGRLGLQLVDTLIKDQLEGSINLKSDHGTQFDIRFNSKVN